MRSTLSSRLVFPLIMLFLIALPILAQAKKPVQTNASFRSADGTMLKAYVARPSAPGRHPGIIMVHEYWGLSADIAAMADRLAKEGFVVLAVDAYRGKLAQTPQEAGALRTGTPADQVAADLDTAFVWLSGQPEVDPARMGSLGFCYGGAQSMLLGSRQAGLKAVVTLYGSGLLQTEGSLGQLG